MQATAERVSAPKAYDEDEFDLFANVLYAHFASKIGDGVPLFETTDAHEIKHNYLLGFPAAERHVYDCRTCLDFLKTYGTLVTIDPFGNVESPIWSIDIETVPRLYRQAVLNVRKFMDGATVTGPFLSSDNIWGTPVTGDWHHLALKPAPSMIYHSAVVTARQAMAAKREDFKNVEFALGVYKQEHLDVALTLLQTEALYRTEKVIGPATWLNDVKQARAASGDRRLADNILWLAVALAPAGFCHPRSSMIGTLLDDIAEGKSLDACKRAFDEKMRPDKYLRPSAPPKTGNIIRAESIVAKLGIEESLRRRHARMDEVDKIWTPNRPPAAALKGVFAHLVDQAEKPGQLRGNHVQDMTWERFENAVLPTADRIEVEVPLAGSFVAFVTAVVPDAPPILQWDHLNARNPVSTYMYMGGSLATSWGLSAGWRDIAGVARHPHQWRGGEYLHQVTGVVLLLDGMNDSRNSGPALFPEQLKHELHSVRSVIEAHSKSTRMERYDPHCAGGLDVWANVKHDVRLRVTTGKVVQLYRIDRYI